jgi:hypothetical protein
MLQRKQLEWDRKDDTVQGYGYGAEAFARSYGQDVVHLPGAGGFLLARALPGPHCDLANPYPVMVCDDWQRLGEVVRERRDDFVSATLLTDPFADVGRRELERDFDFVRLLHRHYVVDLEKRPTAFPSRHHRRKLRTFGTARDIRFDLSPPSLAFLDHWSRLYANLVTRHGIRDFRVFSRDIFRRQLAVPGAVVCTAWEGSDLLGADWYFQAGAHVYAHLSAYSEAGYRYGISYPMMQEAIEYFRPRAACLTLGGVPVTGQHAGLSHFKEGWSTHRLPSYLCGAILQEEVFRDLNGGRMQDPEGFFPGYRAPNVTAAPRVGGHLRDVAEVVGSASS